jgi:hypothetical protein
MGPSLEGDRRYSPAECTGAVKTPIQGRPDPKHVSTSYAERMALHFLFYNFVRIHQTRILTPAMAAGVTKRLWEIGDIVGVLEAWEACKQPS